MPDREKVIKELEERIKVAEECTGNPMFTPDAIRTIVAMLKEQESVEPITVGNDYRQWRCPNCRDRLRYRLDKFCPHCGRSVKWE